MERRIYPRHSIKSAVTLKAGKTKNKLSGTGRASNISAGGIGLSLDTCFPKGTTVNLQAKIHPKKPPLNIKAKVTWSESHPKNNSFNHGMQFFESDTDLLKGTLREINLHDIESFIDTALPDSLKKNYVDNSIYQKLDSDKITEITLLEKPFLKIDKIIIFNSINDTSIIDQNKSLSIGYITPRDTKGYYGDTIFLSFSERLMTCAATVHLAALMPSNIYQVSEVTDTKLLTQKKDRSPPLKPSEDGTIFFVETLILGKKPKTVSANTTFTFGSIKYSMINELKFNIFPTENFIEINAKEYVK